MNTDKLDALSMLQYERRIADAEQWQEHYKDLANDLWQSVADALDRIAGSLNIDYVPEDISKEFQVLDALLDRTEGEL